MVIEVAQSGDASACQRPATRTSVTPRFARVSANLFQRNTLVWITKLTHAVDKMAAKNEPMSILRHLHKPAPPKDTALLLQERRRYENKVEDSKFGQVRAKNHPVGE